MHVTNNIWRIGNVLYWHCKQNWSSREDQWCWIKRGWLEKNDCGKEVVPLFKRCYEWKRKKSLKLYKKWLPTTILTLNGSRGEVKIMYLLIFFWAQQPVEGQGLPTAIYLFVVKGEWLSCQFKGDMVSMLNSLAILYFIRWNFCYSSVAIQIPHDAGLVLNHTVAKIPPPLEI